MAFRASCWAFGCVRQFFGWGCNWAAGTRRNSLIRSRMCMFDHLPFDVFFARQRREQNADPRFEHLDRLRHARPDMMAIVVAPAAAETVFVARPALVVPRQRRPAAFTKHNFTK